MSKTRHILPIFTLYFLTSVAFLTFFGMLFYERERSFIIDEAHFRLGDVRRDLQIKLHENYELKAQDLADINATVINLRTREFVKKDFEITPGIAPNFFDGKNLIVEMRMRARRHANEYLVFIRSDDLSVKFSALKFKIALVGLGVLLAILLIAFFIIRLSLRPLYEKIDFLNSFIRDTTHEINTPLSVILMSIELFKSDPKKYLGNIKIAAATIANLYEDLVALKFNKNIKEVYENVDISAMLDERIEYFSASLEQKNINLTTDIDEVVLKTSKFKLRKIIDNLLSNAIKYCDESGDIGIYLKEGELKIINSGDGITKQNLPHIFKLYTRFDKRNGGFGVGLNLVKKFCDELGFKILCFSQKGRTEFSVKF